MTIISLPVRVQGTAEAAGGKGLRLRVEEIMELVGLPRRLYRNFPNQLSGGQRQRVAVARALINRPEVVICDEPTSALDVSVQSQILNLLQDLRSELNLTYIVISHNLAVVEHMATRVAVMYLGRLVEVADTDSLFDNPQHPYNQGPAGFRADTGPPTWTCPMPGWGLLIRTRWNRRRAVLSIRAASTAWTIVPWRRRAPFRPRPVSSNAICTTRIRGGAAPRPDPVCP